VNGREGKQGERGKASTENLVKEQVE
jgi:hypothetical protein